MTQEKTPRGAPEERPRRHAILDWKTRVETLGEASAESPLGTAQKEKGAPESRSGKESESGQALAGGKSAREEQDQSAGEDQEKTRARSGKQQTRREKEHGDRRETVSRRRAEQSGLDEHQSQSAQESERIGVGRPARGSSRHFPVRPRLGRQQTESLEAGSGRRRADAQDRRAQCLQPHGGTLAPQQKVEAGAGGQSSEGQKTLPNGRLLRHPLPVDGAARQSMESGPERGGSRHGQDCRESPEEKQSAERAIERRRLGHAVKVVYETKRPPRGETSEENRRPDDRIHATGKPREQTRAWEEECERHDGPRRTPRGRERESDRDHQDRQAVGSRRRKSQREQETRSTHRQKEEDDPDAGSRLPHPRWYSDRKSTRLNSSHGSISYAVFCLKNKKCSGLPPSSSSSQLLPVYAVPPARHR